MAKRFLDEAGIAYETVIANEDIEQTTKYEIRQAPTLVVIQKGKAEHYVNVSNIRRYIEESATVPV